MKITKRKIMPLLAVALFALVALCMLFAFSDKATANAQHAERNASVASVTINGKANKYTDIYEAFSAANGADSAATITMLNDVTIDPTSGNGNGPELEIAAGKTVTLDLNNKAIRGNFGDRYYSVIVVKGNLTLVDTAKKKTAKTVTKHTTATATEQVTLTTSGGVITGGTGNNNGMFGGGVRVLSNGTFTMEGGIIAGNAALGGWGGGVCVRPSGTFEMKGGEISHNAVSIGGGGGVCVDSGGAFNMTGGNICYNAAVAFNGMLNGGGGVCVGAGEAVKECVIGGNAVISHNTSERSGGGIYVHQNAEMTLEGNASVTDNTAASGGGIYCGSNSQLDLYGGTVTGNGTATENTIGGVFFTGATLNVQGAPQVGGNTAGAVRQNLYIGATDGRKPMHITGALKEGDKYAELYLYHGAGTVTSGYSTYNSDIAPSKVIKCDVNMCAKLTENEAVLGAHAYNVEPTIDVEPTCTEKGSKSNHCLVCDDQTGVTEIEALGHDYDTEFTTDVEPTCTEKGSKSKHCLRCDTQTDVTELNALGHDYDTEFTIDQQPTLTEKGSKSRHCSRCDDQTDVTEIPMLVAQLVKPDKDGGEVDEVIVSLPSGFTSDVELVVTEIASEDYSRYETTIRAENGVVSFAYDVSLRSDGVEIQPSGTITIKLRIPQNLKDKPFKLFHMHGSEATRMPYTIDGNYAVVTTDSLSAFVFVGEKETDTGEKGLSDGAIAGIAIASVLGVLIVLYVVGLVLYKKSVIDWKICKAFYFYIKRANTASSVKDDAQIVEEMAEHAIEIDEEQVTELDAPSPEKAEEQKTESETPEEKE